jgi:hypothetical protein
MEVLIRWVCRCDPSRPLCPYCKGAGYFERWVPVDLVPYVMGGRTYIFLDRRMILPPKTGAA